MASTPPERERRRTTGIAGALLLAGAAAAGALAAFARWFLRPPPGKRWPLFPRGSTAVFLGLLASGLLAALAVPAALMLRARSPAVTGQFRAPEQPVPYSHRIHVQGLEIDCRYCHTSAETSAEAGMPSTDTCVPCHSDVWLASEPFAPVRASLRTGLPIPWQRVNRLPDYTYFHHGIHAAKGIGCESCHGRMDRVDGAVQAAPLTMQWCLDCHRAPVEHLRPRERITAMGWRGTPALQRKLAAEYQVRENVTYCTACHR